MKARLLISAVVALLGAIAAAQFSQKRGDPSSTIAEFERALDTSFQEKMIFPSGNLSGTSVKKYRVTDVDGRVLQIERTDTPTEADLEPLFGLVAASLGQLSRSQLPPQLERTIGEVRQVSPGWNDLPPLWRSLTFTNQQAAEAKAMLRYESKPNSVADHTWNQRFQTAATLWQIEEVRTRRLHMAVFGAGGAVGGFTGALIALALVSWMWCFLLARIRELSDALRGK
jgi:hypothetical protein